MAMVSSVNDLVCFNNKGEKRLMAVRDWSLITRRGGATKWENCGSDTLLHTHARQGKTFSAPLLKSGHFLRPPTSMAKTSSSRIKTTPKLVVPPPPLQHGLNFFRRPFHRGKTLHAPPPLSFCNLPPPPLSVISDQSLNISEDQSK